jgi:hypothetical protein
MTSTTATAMTMLVSSCVGAPATLLVVDVLVLPDSAFADGTSVVAGAAVVGAAVEFAVEFAVALVGDAVVGGVVVVAGAAVVGAAVDVTVAVAGDAVDGGAVGGVAVDGGGRVTPAYPMTLPAPMLPMKTLPAAVTKIAPGVTSRFVVAVVTTPALDTIRILLLLVSATKRYPFESTHTSLGPENVAAVPVPSARPDVPAVPANVETDWSVAIFRITCW